ncbi:MAG TPA: hypothetical protein VHJ20_04675 [Polyangia bacterium]|nr:hypothetical protein [Polyangia bacterium]
MKIKAMKVLGGICGLIGGLALLAAVGQGCGGDSSSGDLNSICMQGCAKAVQCSGGVETMQECMTGCLAIDKTSSGATCSNSSAIVAKAQTCAAMSDCTMASACIQTIPACEGGSSGGSTGSNGGSTGSNGGSTGSNGGSTGSSGGGDCSSVCTRAVTCCMAITPTSPCSQLPSACTNAQSSAQAQADCQQILTAGAMIPGFANSCK